jgi:hypothetical protein
MNVNFVLWESPMNNIAQQARLRGSLEELDRRGCPVDPSVADTVVENKKVEIEQCGGVLESRLFELESGLVAYLAYITVTNQTSRTIYVVDVELWPGREERLFQWVTPLEVKSHGRGKRENSYLVYRFPGKHGLEFGYREVINHPLLQSKKLPSRRPLGGWLMGIGGLMPAGLVHGQLQDVHLTIIGADHAEYSTTLHLSTERLQVRPKIVKSRRSIFAELAGDEAMIGRDVTPTAPLSASQPPASNAT